jgi:hypothetical protein
LAEEGLDDGRFLVRSRNGKPNEYVIAVVFRGNPTHHLVATGADGGALLVNKKSFGDHRTIGALIEALGHKQKGWPVALDKPVKPGATTKVIAPEPSSRGGDAQSAMATKVGGGGGGVGGAAEEGAGGRWLHGPLTKEAAEALLAQAALDDEVGRSDGRFLVWERSGPRTVTEYVVSVIFKGKPTHHMVVSRDDGVLTINQQSFGDRRTITDLVKTLGHKQKGWPVALNMPVLVPDVSDPVPTSAAAQPSKSLDPTVDLKKGSVDDAPRLTTSERTAVRATDETGSAVPPPPAPVSVEHALEAEHASIAAPRTIEKTGEGSDVRGNNVANDIKPFASVGSVSDSSSLSPAPVMVSLSPGWSAVVSIDADPPGCPRPAWAHGKLKKLSASAIVSSRATGGGVDGAWLVWERQQSPVEFGLSVYFQHEATHHLLSANPQTTRWLVNGKDFGQHSTLVSLVEALQRPLAGWPIPLTTPVPVSDVAAAAASATLRSAPFEVTLVRGSVGGFGIKFYTGKDGRSWVVGVKPGSPAAMCGLIKASLEIVSIKGLLVTTFDSQI